MKQRKKLDISASFLAVFLLWTVIVRTLDVRPIGPLSSSVGLAGLNGFFHDLTGVHMTLYLITDWLGLVPVFIALAFACLGLIQWVQRKRIRLVDRSILILGGFYMAVAAAYLFFEEVVVNYRPVLINGCLEASYPSSTTLLVLCVMPTAAMQLRGRIPRPRLRQWVTGLITAFSALMVVGRLVSGVHWVTDIIGGALLSAGLVMLYAAFSVPKE